MDNDKNKQQESLYSKDLFNDEMEMINDELDNLDSLYNELKIHFDKIKNSQARGSLSFIKDQTSNLISIKTAKLNYIKQRADMKRNLTDFAFKEKASSNRESEGLDSITAEIYKKIANDFKYVPDKHQILESNEVSDIDQILDEELNDVDIDSIVESTTNVEDPHTTGEVIVEYNPEDESYSIVNENLPNNLDEKSEDESDNSITVVDLDTLTFYKLDKDNFDIIEELGSLEKIIDTTEIEDEIYAIGESGTVYLTVIFEEDEE